MPFITIKNLKKSFGNLEVLKNISFDIETGDVIAIIGSSGSGKSTLLRSLINIEKIDDGTISIDGENLVHNGKYPSKDEIKNITAKMGMVFQNFNLFPHMNVINNLVKPYILVNPKANDALEKAENLLLKVGLRDKSQCFPSKLSGGQQQRVAIARALMQNPEIMLFDEPTSALDPQLTGEVLEIMKKLAAEKMTMLVVTHEMSFAKNVANKIIYMKNGVIVEAGFAKELFENPKEEETKKFLKPFASLN
ncbi:MAG: amino acid ABC transporter ATP-binding protein [Oscillospiraceae bacterium]